MEYPLPLMKISELVKLGFTKDQLMEYANIQSCPAIKINPEKKNSPWLFDTEEFEKWRKKRCSTT